MPNIDYDYMVINGVRYKLPVADCKQIQQILSSRGCKVLPATMTDALVKHLIGHTNVVYYNFETNKWNTDNYNGYMITSQFLDTKRAQEFKVQMDKYQPFCQQYELVVSVTMTINDAFYKGWLHPVSKPKYNSKGNAVVGNIIVKNKETGKYELYGKDWVGVCPCGDILAPSAVKSGGAYNFAHYGATEEEFRAALVQAHTR